MATLRPQPYLWVTWLSKLLAGEQQCHYASWYRAHHTFAKRVDPNFNLAKWTADHNVLVARRAAQLRTEGWTVKLENENAFRLQGRAATLAGKPDLVATRDQEVLVVDGKTGQQKHSDWWQLLIYLAVLPKLTALTGRLSGEVCYPSHWIPVAADELTETRERDIWALVRQLAAHTERPDPTPSAGECRFCDLTTADCSMRIDAPVQTVSTLAF